MVKFGEGEVDPYASLKKDIIQQFTYKRYCLNVHE
jgi:hypothetical protein